MNNLAILNKTVKDNQTVNGRQSTDKSAQSGTAFQNYAPAPQNKEFNLGEFKNILLRVIKEWESFMSEKTGNKNYEGFSELAALIGISSTSLYKYTCITKDDTPTVLTLIRITNATKDNRLLNYLADYGEKLTN